MHSHYGAISFQVAAAKLWNMAPFQLKSVQNIDSFKSNLKMCLFMLTYSVEVDISVCVLHVPTKKTLLFYYKFGLN